MKVVARCKRDNSEKWSARLEMRVTPEMRGSGRDVRGTYSDRNGQE